MHLKRTAVKAETALRAQKILQSFNVTRNENSRRRVYEYIVFAESHGYYIVCRSARSCESFREIFQFFVETFNAK